MTTGEPETQIIAEDIAEQKRAEEALLACRLQLQQSLKLEAMGQLAGSLAHDLNTPYTSASALTSAPAANRTFVIWTMFFGVVWRYPSTPFADT